MNKKAIGTPSGMFIAILLSLTLLISFSVLLVSLIGSYQEKNPSLKDVEQFDGYEEIWADYQSYGNEIKQSQDLINRSNATTIVGQVTQFFEEQYNKIQNSFLFSGFRTITKFSKLMFHSQRVVGKTMQNSGIMIPEPIRIFILTGLAVVSITLLVRVFLRYRDT